MRRRHRAGGEPCALERAASPHDHPRAHAECLVAKTAVGLCPQEIALYRDLYPPENLRFFCDIYGLAKADAARRLKSLIELFGLARFAHTPISALSGGWQRRVNIAVALVHSPSILVLDEPTAGLDVEARQEVRQTIELLKKQGMTILLTTHHLDVAEHLCSRIAIMKDGRIGHEGTIPQLLSLVPAKAVALAEAPGPDLVQARARELGWASRHYAGRLACLLLQQVSLEQVVQALSGTGISSVSHQRISLDTLTSRRCTSSPGPPEPPIKRWVPRCCGGGA